MEEEEERKDQTRLGERQRGGRTDEVEEILKEEEKEDLGRHSLE